MRTKFKPNNEIGASVRKLHVKTGDNVVVLSGKYKGKKGKVLQIHKKRSMATVEGINVVTKHQKARSEGEIGGLIKKEIPIHTAKIQVVCPSCAKSCRVGRKIMEDGKHLRYCKKCNEVIG